MLAFLRQAIDRVFQGLEVTYLPLEYASSA